MIIGFTMKSYQSWDDIEIAYHEWGGQGFSPPVVIHHGFVVDANVIFESEDPRGRRLVVGGVGSGVIECGGVDRRAVPNDAIPGATLRILSGDHIGAIADPRFTQSIVDFLA